MDNVFDKFKLENKEVEIEGLGTVTIRPLTMAEFLSIANDINTKDTSKMIKVQFKIVSDCLVNPKMTVKQLEALGKDALEPITEIFTAIQGGIDEEGKS